MSLLEGITVVAVEHAVAAPLASRHLADLGARVIKIERPGTGDFSRAYDAAVKGLSSHFVWLNHSKESLTLDLSRREGAEVLERLLQRADVFVHNLGPGSMDRLGFGTPRVRAAFPGLVVCTISGFGATGPYRDRKAYDLLVQGETGLLSITGTPDTPSRAGISVADLAAGMYALTGVLAALVSRARTGQGAALEVSLFDALAEWMSYPAYYTAHRDSAPGRSGPYHAVIAPYGPFTAGDGRVVILAVQNQREWDRFCRGVLHRPELLDDPRFSSNALRVEHRDALGRVIHDRFRSLTAEGVVERLRAADLAYGSLNSVQEFLAHPQLEARDRWQIVDSPAGPLRMLRPPFSVDGHTEAMGRVPRLGEHTDAILGELGFDPATIAGWRAVAIV